MGDFRFLRKNLFLIGDHTTMKPHIIVDDGVKIRDVIVAVTEAVAKMESRKAKDLKVAKQRSVAAQKTAKERKLKQYERLKKEFGGA